MEDFDLVKKTTTAEIVYNGGGEYNKSLYDCQDRIAAIFEGKEEEYASSIRRFRFYEAGGVLHGIKPTPWHYLVKRMSWDMCESLNGDMLFVSRKGKWYILGESNGEPVVLLTNSKEDSKWQEVIPEETLGSFQSSLK